MRVKITGLVAAGGAFSGGVIVVVLHFLAWRTPGPTGGWTFYPDASPRRYADYLPADVVPGSSLVVRLRTSGGAHPSWLPLLPVSIVTGLVAGAALGGLVLAYRAWGGTSAASPNE